MNLKSWLSLVEKVVPLVLAATPAAPLAPFISIGIQAAEQIPGATGSTKLVIAKQIAGIGVAAVNAQAGHQEVDPALIDQVATDGINAVVGVVNLKHANQAEDAAEVPKA